MKYYKTIVDGYVFAISTGSGQEEISENEYNFLMDIIQSSPSAPTGYDYRLRADTLEWELFELPPVPDPMGEDIDDAEAFDIIFGGGAE